MFLAPLRCDGSTALFERNRTGQRKLLSADRCRHGRSVARRHAMSKAFNLTSYDDVKRHAAAIYDRIRGVGAPACRPPPRGEGPWSQSRIELFAKWMADGY